MDQQRRPNACADETHERGNMTRRGIRGHRHGRTHQYQANTTTSQARAGLLAWYLVTYLCRREGRETGNSQCCRAARLPDSTLPDGWPPIGEYSASASASLSPANRRHTRVQTSRHASRWRRRETREGATTFYHLPPGREPVCDWKFNSSRRMSR